jgi:chromosomal replication initiation ATPase DnaA
MSWQSPFMPRPQVMRGPPPMPVVPIERVRAVTPEIRKSREETEELERRVEATLAALERRRADATARLNRAILATARAVADEDEARAMSCETWKLKDLLDIVLAVTELPKVGLLSERRDAEAVKARHILFWLARRFTLRSLPDIGRRTGGREHTTVLHGTRKVDAVVKIMEVSPGDETPEAWAKLLWEKKWPTLPPFTLKR